MANESMPGIYKVGLTTRDPLARLAEANKADTWRPPTEYTLVDVVRVCDMLATEQKLHEWMTEKGWRIHPRREFFKAPLSDIKIMLDNVEAPIGHPWTAPEDDAGSDDEPYYHPSLMPKKAAEPSGAAKHMHLRSGRLVR